MKDALVNMQEGQVAKLFIPSNLAYGKRGVAGIIPPDKELVFDIQVLKVIDKKE